MSIKKLVYYWLPPLLWMLMIFILSSRQSISVSDQYTYNFLLFKTLHITEYAFLYTLLYRALRRTTKVSFISCLVIAFIISLAFAISDETHQIFVPTREGSVRDVFIDSIGITSIFFVIKYNVQDIKKYL